MNTQLSAFFFFFSYTPALGRVSRFEYMYAAHEMKEEETGRHSANERERWSERHFLFRLLLLSCAYLYLETRRQWKEQMGHLRNGVIVACKQ